MRKPKVSFVTVNYKTPHFIRHLLRGIDEAKPAFSYEYFIVDNASDSDTLDPAVRRYPWATLIKTDRNLGFGGGNNLGISRATGEYVVLLNPDLTVFPGELDAWIEWMDRRPDVGISGPRTLNPDGTDQYSSYRFPGPFIPLYRRTLLGATPWGRRAIASYLMHDMDRNAEQDVDWVQGSAMCIRRSVLEHVGPFDERFFMYFEDTDLCRRVWEAGHRVAYTPQARFVHYLQRESRTKYPWEALTNRLARAHIQSGITYFLKYRGKPTSRGA
ncbi:glycosyltransferase family 2 protein [Candidatus Uhrbacteria bacterium]|nr:MAG: glycosyltransferase family 2 protein [Candidatus Uhrbacteria bacterium]